VAFAVTRRTREIGIRLTLGGRRPQVMWSLARGVAGLVGIGTGLGLGLSVLLMLAMRAWSSGSASLGIGNIDVYRPSFDPLALLAIAVVTVLVGMVATLLPARRATRMDPLVALRHD
jgi:ABC-type antimicrobial peptide transport system permease subunit